MDPISVLIIGTAVASNIIVIMWKFNKGRLSDALLDGSLLITVSYVLKASTFGLMVGTVASCIVSMWLIFFLQKNILLHL